MSCVLSWANGTTTEQVLSGKPHRVVWHCPHEVTTSQGLGFSSADLDAWFSPCQQNGWVSDGVRTQGRMYSFKMRTIAIKKQSLTPNVPLVKSLKTGTLESDHLGSDTRSVLLPSCVTCSTLLLFTECDRQTLRWPREPCLLVGSHTFVSFPSSPVCMGPVMCP